MVALGDNNQARNLAENLLELEVKYMEDPWTDDISRFYGEDKRPIEIRSTGPYWTKLKLGAIEIEWDS